ncbi:MAG TPA: hypothetical protein VF787_17755 [Thermoanaerobaculia bacterium]
MKTKSLIALSILCLALGACATTDTAADDPNIAKAADHANQSTPAARADYVAYSSLTPNTEQKTVTTTTTEPVWNASVENPTDATLTATSSTTSTGTMASGSTTVDGTATVTDTTIADNTASLSTSTTTTNTTSTSSSSSPSSMASSSSNDDDDDTTTTSTTTETRKRLRKD